MKLAENNVKSKPFILKSIHDCKVNVVFSDVPSNNLRKQSWAFFQRYKKINCNAFCINMNK